MKLASRQKKLLGIFIAALISFLLLYRISFSQKQEDTLQPNHYEAYLSRVPVVPPSESHYSAFDEIRISWHCSGECISKEFTITIKGDGTLFYNEMGYDGKKSKEVSSELSKRDVAKLVAAINGNNYVFLSKRNYECFDRSDSAQMDMSVIIDAVKMDVRHYLGCFEVPKELREFEKTLQEVIQDAGIQPDRWE